MGPEQEPDLTDKSDIDPSIDPKGLIEQNGENAGRIAATETSVGETTVGTEADQGGPHIEQGEIVEGLAVIGAEAENQFRDFIKNPEDSEYSISKEQEEQLNEEHAKLREDGKSEVEIEEILSDKAGTETMATEVKSRAEKLAKEKFPLASPELVEQFAQKASEKFKAELETKNAEKKAEHDKGVQAMIDSLDSPDTPLSSVVPEQESEAAKAFR